jgi:SAM-dependent methyltransferase
MVGEWADACHRAAQAAIVGPKPDYNRYHANIAASYLPISGRDVLVVGCNRGDDCRYFVEFGSRKVVGLDVMDEIGLAFPHPVVEYRRASIESAPIDNGEFDFVFCFATMEHVPGIERAFGEMVRGCREGGVIYCLAAPLWHTRQGPHWGAAFDDFPWIHLRLTKEEIFAYVDRKRRQGFENPYYEQAQMEYCLDPANFNMRRARDYVNACAMLNGVEIIRNDIEFESHSNVDRSIVGELVKKGYDAFDLFGLTHTLVARKL